MTSADNCTFRAENVPRSLLRNPSLLAGSCNNASCKKVAMVRNGWNERWTVLYVIRYKRMSLGWLFFPWASMTFFQHFTVEETACWVALLLTYLLGCFSRCNMLRVFVDKICLRNEIFLYHAERNDSETVFRSILSEKKLVPHGNNTPTFH